jgi:hypothetical protein
VNSTRLFLRSFVELALIFFILRPLKLWNGLSDDSGLWIFLVPVLHPLTTPFCRINEFNTDALFECVLPFHDTPQFVAVVSTFPERCVYCTCNFFYKLMQVHSDKWKWLNFVKKTKVALNRKNLVKRCLSESSMISTLCRMVWSIISRRIRYIYCSFRLNTLLQIISLVPVWHHSLPRQWFMYSRS